VRVWPSVLARVARRRIVAAMTALGVCQPTIRRGMGTGSHKIECGGFVHSLLF